MSIQISDQLVIEITNKVKEVLEIEQDIDVHQDLVELGLDSLVSVSLLVDIEEMYSILFDDEEMIIDNFSSIYKVCKLVSGKLCDRQ